MEELIKLTEQQEKILSGMGMQPAGKQLQEARKCFLDPVFRILLTGEYNRGKSTLLNALLGEEVLRTSLLRVPIVNIIKSGKEKTAQTIFDNTITPVDWKKLADQENVKSAELSWDTNFFQDRIELVEYPSMSEALDRKGFEQAVEIADLVILVVSADSLYSNVEAEVYKETFVPNGHSAPIIVVNSIDRIAQKDLEEVKRAAQIRLPVNQDRIFFVSAQQAMDGHEEAKAAVSALQDKLVEAAANRKQIKEGRLHKVAAYSLNIALEKTESASNSMQQQRAATDAAIQPLRKNLKQLQDLSIRIQRDLIEFRNGTRDVLQGKMDHFFKELSLNVEQWANDFRGTDLTGHLNERLKTQMTSFSQEDFGMYLGGRLQQQEELLYTGFEQYQRELEKLYGQLNKEVPTINLQVDLPPINPALNQVQLAAEQSTSASRFNLRSLLEVPESLITLIGSAAGSIMYLRFAPYLIPIGLGASIFFAYRKKSTKSNTINVKDYQMQIIQHGRRIQPQILEQIFVVIDKLHKQLGDLMNNTTEQARKEALSHIADLQGQLKEEGDERQQLENIRQALEVLA